MFGCFGCSIIVSCAGWRRVSRRCDWCVDAGSSDAEEARIEARAPRPHSRANRRHRSVSFLPRDAMQAWPMSSCSVCLSVCVCVRHVRRLCQNE